MNTSVLNYSYAVYSHVEGKPGAMAIIDKPYILPISRTKDALRYIIAGIVSGFVIAYVCLWLRERSA